MKKIFALCAIMLMIAVSGFTQNQTFKKQGSTVIEGDLIVTGNMKTGIVGRINYANPWTYSTSPFFESNKTLSRLASTSGTVISLLATGNLLPGTTGVN